MWSLVLKVGLLVVAVCLAGCAAPNEKSDYVVGAHPGKGLVVFSMSIQGDSTLGLGLRGVGRDEEVLVLLTSRRFNTNSDWDSPRGRLAYLELIAGEYEIFEWQTESTGDYYPLSDPVRFSCLPERVTYIGNIYVDVLRKPRAYKYELSDKSERDLSLLAERLPNVNIDKVVKKLAVKKKKE